MANPNSLITDDSAVRTVAEGIAGCGRMAFDLEFVSEGRYIPELSLVQVAWGDDYDPEIAVIDCVTADPTPVLALIADEGVATVAHSAKQDLGLLAVRYSITARSFWDTQIAAAFLGIADQIGYAKLVEQLLGVQLDKGLQFTAWLDRPLSAKQIRYAVDDVRYLPRIWHLLQSRLRACSRLAWVGEESARLAAAAMPFGPAEDAYRDVKGCGSLRDQALSRLRAVAAWRQTQALADNRPLSWLLADQAMVEVCKRDVRTPEALRRIRGIGDGTVRRYGAAILAQLAKAKQKPPPAAPTAKSQPSNRAQIWANIIVGLIQARCADAGIAARFVGPRADAEALAIWFDRSGGNAEPDIPLLHGWRRELVGALLLGWLRGESGLRCCRDGDEALALVAINANDDTAAPKQSHIGCETQARPDGGEEPTERTPST